MNDISEAKSSNTSSLMFALLAVVLAVYPYVFVINILRPATGLMGKNVYIMLLTCVILLAFIFCIKALVIRHGIYLLPLIFLPILFIFTMRILIMDETIKYIISSKAPLLFIILWGTAVAYLKDQKRKDIVCKIIIINCVIQAVVGIIHYYFFPEIMTYGLSEVGTDSGDLYRINESLISVGSLREPGLLLNPTVYANFILLGIFVLVRRYKNRKDFMMYIGYGFALLMLWGVFLSKSRYPIGISLFLMIYYMMKTISIKSVVIVCILCFAMYSVLFPFITGAANKFKERGAVIRSIKNEVGINLVTGSLRSVLIGESDDVVRNTTSRFGMVFSDNSYIMLMLSFGVPFFLIWIGIVLVLFSQTINVRQNIFMLLYFFGNLWFTNSLLWDIWILFYLMALYSLQTDERPSRVAVPSPNLGYEPAR